jgi:hypothetical protein
MQFYKLFYNEKSGNYDYKDGEGIEVCIVGCFLLSDVRCNTQLFSAWILADKNDPNSKFSHSIGGNLTQLEEYEGNVFLREWFSEEEVPTEIAIPREQFIKLLDDWENKVCKSRPQEVIIKYENSEYSIETKNG